MRALILALICLLSLVPPYALAGDFPPPQERDMSDTLDLWRQGRYEQLFMCLAHRGRSSREAFQRRMARAERRPSCCFRKLNDFRVVRERNDQATVFASIGLEAIPGAEENCTREFRMIREEGMWKMQMNDIYSLAGVTGRKR